MGSAFYVGIDPGLSGAIGLLEASTGNVSVLQMPVMDVGGGKREINTADLDRLLELHLPIIGAVIEKVGAMPKQGVTSMFTFGQSYGEVLGLLKSSRIPYEKVLPTRWKSAILSGTVKDKDAAVAYVTSHYPSCSLLPTPRCKVKSHNMAEAVCLAVFAKRVFDSVGADVGG